MIFLFENRIYWLVEFYEEVIRLDDIKLRLGNGDGL